MADKGLRIQEAVGCLYVHWSSFKCISKNSLHWRLIFLPKFTDNALFLFTGQTATAMLCSKFANTQTAFLVQVPWRSCRLIFDLLKTIETNSGMSWFPHCILLLGGEQFLSHLLWIMWLLTKCPAAKAAIRESSPAITVPHTILASWRALSPGLSVLAPWTPSTCKQEETLYFRSQAETGYIQGMNNLRFSQKHRKHNAELTTQW